MNFWREYEDGNGVNIYDDIEYVKECIENELSDDVLANILEYSKRHNNNLQFAASLALLGGKFGLQVLGESRIFVGSEWLKVIIANNIQKIITEMITIEPESIWFINFLVTQIT